jgi:hypothetical protein
MCSPRTRGARHCAVVWAGSCPALDTVASSDSRLPLRPYRRLARLSALIRAGRPVSCVPWADMPPTSRLASSKGGERWLAQHMACQHATLSRAHKPTTRPEKPPGPSKTRPKRLSGATAVRSHTAGERPAATDTSTHRPGATFPASGSELQPLVTTPSRQKRRLSIGANTNTVTQT